jgi:hypothetical protein
MRGSLGAPANTNSDHHPHLLQFSSLANRYSSKVKRTYLVMRPAKSYEPQYLPKGFPLAVRTVDDEKFDVYVLDITLHLIHTCRFARQNTPIPHESPASIQPETLVGNVSTLENLLKQNIELTTALLNQKSAAAVPEILSLKFRSGYIATVKS